MFVSATNVGKTEYLLRILETEYKNHFEFIVIMCPAILDNSKTYLSRKWIFDDNNVFIMCDVEGKLNEWIKLFRNTLKFPRHCLLLTIVLQKVKQIKRRTLSELAFSDQHRNHSFYGSLCKNIIIYPKT